MELVGPLREYGAKELDVLEELVEDGLRVLVRFDGFSKLEKGDCVLVDDLGLNKVEKWEVEFVRELEVLEVLGELTEDVLNADNGLLLVVFVGFRKLERGDCVFVDGLGLNKFEKGFVGLF